MLAKNIFLVAAFFLPGFNSIAQTYSVLHTEGAILKTAAQKALVTGDTFLASDSLTFTKLLSWAVVISPSGDLLFVQSSEIATKASKQVLTPIERGVHPVKRKENIPVKDLSVYFKGDQFVFIGNDFSIPIDTESYELNEKLFLLYRYEFNSRIITHKLPFNKESISFNPAFLYEYKGEKIPAQKTTNTELAHFDSNTNLPTFVARFRPVWLNEEQLKKELHVLVKVYSSNKKIKESKLNTTALFLAYVQDIYGQTDEFYFSEWVQKSYYSQ